MPNPNLIDASKEGETSKKNKKVLRGDKAKKVLSKVTKKDEKTQEPKKRNASEARKKLYGKD